VLQIVPGLFHVGPIRIIVTRHTGFAVAIGDGIALRDVGEIVTAAKAALEWRRSPTTPEYPHIAADSR
jgi:hypothetical protein